MIPEEYPYASPPGAKLSDPTWPADAAARPVKFPPQPLLETDEFSVPRLTMIVAVVMVLASIANAIMLPAAENIRPGGPGFILGVSYVCTMAGSLAGQAALLSVLVVFGTGSIWLRQAWHWGLALLAFVAWSLGWMLAFSDSLVNGEIRTAEFVAAFLGLPLVALIAQAGPWLLRIYAHWRIERPADAPSPEAAQPLSIRDLLVWTVVVAATISLVRVGKPGDVSETDYWAVWGIVSTTAAGLAILGMLPMVYLTLGVDRAIWGAVGVVAIATAAATIACSILIYFNPGGPTDREIILMFSSLAFGFTFTLAAPLWLARWYGYRLLMGRPVLEPPLMSPFAPAGKEP